MVIITGWTLKTSILLDTGEIGGKHQETLGFHQQTMLHTKLHGF
jgi:hypothetical protein